MWIDIILILIPFTSLSKEYVHKLGNSLGMEFSAIGAFLLLDKLSKKVSKSLFDFNKIKKSLFIINIYYIPSIVIIQALTIAFSIKTLIIFEIYRNPQNLLMYCY